MKFRYLLSMLVALIFLCSANAQDGMSAFEQSAEAAKQAMMTDPQAAFDAAAEAQAIAMDNKDQGELAIAGWLKGEALNRMNRPAEAISVLDGALSNVNSNDAGSKLQADLYKARADAASATGQYADGLAFYEKAHDIFGAIGEDRNLAITLLNIANIYADARNYDKALSYYEQAQESYSEEPQIELALLNNIATAYREMEEFDQAAIGLESALAIATEMQSPMLQVRILSNLSAVQLDGGQIDLAQSTLARAIEINAEHPSAWEPFLFALEARLEFALGDADEAASLMDRAFADVDPASSPIAFVEFHKAAHEIYEQAGRPQTSLMHLQAFKRLDDEMRDISASANTSLIGAQFDFAAQELRIERLRTETLEQEVRLNEARARQRLVMLIGGSSIMLIILLGGTVHYFSMRMSRNQVRRANAELETTNEALEDALKAKSEFLATTSHEIRTPLNAILGMSELLAAKPQLDEDSRERAELVYSSGLSMKAIVDDILDMAKFEAGSVTVDEQTCEIRAALETVTQVWQADAQKKGLCLSSDFTACPDLAMTDERKIRQIVLNLISNAVKFTEQGEIVIRAEHEQCGDQDWLIVSINDTGCGVPTTELDTIFEPFYQVDSTTTRQHSGTGLGLAISRKLAEAMNGTLTVESELGTGSKFQLRVPIKGAEVRDSDSAAATDAEQSLLLVVPNPLHQSMLKAFLGDEAQGVQICNSIDVGIMLAAAGSFTAIYVSTDAFEDLDEAMLQTLSTVKSMAQTSALIVGGAIGGLSREQFENIGVEMVLAGGLDLPKLEEALKFHGWTTAQPVSAAALKAAS